MVESHTEKFVELPSDPGLQKVVCPPEHFVSVAAPDLSRTLASECLAMRSLYLWRTAPASLCLPSSGSLF